MQGRGRRQCGSLHYLHRLTVGPDVGGRPVRDALHVHGRAAAAPVLNWTRVVPVEADLQCEAMNE